MNLTEKLEAAYQALLASPLAEGHTADELHAAAGAAVRSDLPAPGEP